MRDHWSVFLPSMPCGLWNTVFLVSGSDKLDYYTNSLRYYLRKIETMAMPPQDLLESGSIQRNNYNIMTMLVCVLVNHLADLGH